MKVWLDFIESAGKIHEQEPNIGAGGGQVLYDSL